MKRIPKYEYQNPKQAQNPSDKTTGNDRRAVTQLFEAFEIGTFGFVSDLEFRISDFPHRAASARRLL